MNLGIREAWGDDQIFFRCGCQMMIWRNPDSLGTFPVKADCCDAPHFVALQHALHDREQAFTLNCETFTVIYR